MRPDRPSILVIFVSLLLLAACSSSNSDDAADTELTQDSADSGSDATSDPGPTLTVGSNQQIEVHDEAHVFWTGWDEGQNARQIDIPVTFPPASELYSEITLDFLLSCPGRCDPWDRYGSLGVVRNPGTDDEVFIEISRFITPFGVGAFWDIDMPELRPLLTGDAVLRVFIDTWVGPGSQYGDGWQVDTSFAFIGGEPESRAVATVPVWPRQGVVYGDPERPVTEQLPETTVEVPTDASELSVRLFVTGHGQGNTDNCAEFCPREHTVVINGESYTREIWRDDCVETAAPNQQGTWQYARAGWCPGAEAHPWTIDGIPVPEDGQLVVSYDIEPFENLCRPGSDDCSSCALGTGCEYDGSNHTEPRFEISALAIAWE